MKLKYIIITYLLSNYQKSIMKKNLLFSFVAILLMGCEKNSENLPAPNYSIDGPNPYYLYRLNTNCN